MSKMARITAAEGRVVLIDIGLPGNKDRLGVYLACLWQRMGDFLYDQPRLMQAAGLEVSVFEEFGLGHHIRAVVGQKPGERRITNQGAEAARAI